MADALGGGGEIESLRLLFPQRADIPDLEVGVGDKVFLYGTVGGWSGFAQLAHFPQDEESLARRGDLEEALYGEAHTRGVGVVAIDNEAIAVRVE